MKPALVVFGFLSIILSFGLSFGTNQVIDSRGEAVFPGMSYYVVPYLQNPFAGGFKLDNLGHPYDCPVTFLQDYTIGFRGVALQFKRPGITPGPGIIFTGTQVLVKVTQGQKPSCALSDEVVMFFDKKINKTCLGIGGPEDHRFAPTFYGRFHFEQPGMIYAYYIVFCHADAPKNCSNLGRYDNHEGGRRLVLVDNDTKPILFKLVNTLTDKPPPPNVKN